jgi:hypothetical protein
MSQATQVNENIWVEKEPLALKVMMSSFWSSWFKSSDLVKRLQTMISYMGKVVLIDRFLLN